MFLLHELDQLLHFKQVGWRHLVAVQQHALRNLSLNAIVDVQELLDIVAVDDVLGVLWIGGVKADLAILFQGDSGDTTNSLLHDFREPGEEEICCFWDLSELAEASFLRSIND